MTGDPWQPPPPVRRPPGRRIPDTQRTALFHLVTDTVMLQPDSYTHAVVDAIITAGWRPPPPRIARLEQLDQLTPGTVLRSTAGALFTVGGKRRGGHGLLDAEVIWQP